jgi:subtilisin-like proprotein convertase family protein
MYNLFQVNIDHKYRGSVLVSLISPAGTESKLATERQQDRYKAL